MSTCWTRVVGGVEEPGLLGRDAAGQLVYSPEGYMSAHLMRRGRVRFGTQDVVGPSVRSSRTSCCL
jgi:hypothetical protein